jgi:MFS family permease
VSLVFIPQPPVSEASSEHKGNLWREVKYGFRYIVERRSLLGLQMMFFFSNLFATLGFVLLSPMILARTGNDSVQLGSAMSVGAVGGLIGAILVSAWGGPRRRVHGVLLGMAASSLLGQVTVGLGRALPVWAIGGFCSAFFIGIINSSNQAIWQAKVAPDVQGRVFATRRLIAQITAPAAMLVAGPLADVIFEPAMMPDGLLADTFGPIVGTGPGAGMALILVITGLLGGMAALSGYLFPAIRNAEDLIPDHDVDPEKLAQTTGLQLEMAGMLPPDMSAPSAAEGAVIAGD